MIFNIIQRNSRSLKALLLFALLSSLVCRTTQQYAGYNDITLTSVPSDTYTITNRITSFPCSARGVSQSTNTTHQLDVIFFRGQTPLSDKYNLPSRHYYQNTDGVTVNGLLINPTTLADDGVSFKCQVYINGQLVNVASAPVTLTVADGRPGAIPLNLSTRTIQSATVEWSSLLLPQGGNILYYQAQLYDSSEQIISTTNITSTSNRKYTFTGLIPDTTYKSRLVGVNGFGVGNLSSLFSFQTLPSLQAPSPPSVSFNILANGNLSVTWEMPTITNYMTTYPIIYYSLQYYQTNSPSLTAVTTNTSDNLTLSVVLTNLVLYQEYTFRLTSVNHGSGTPNYISRNFVIVPYTAPTSSNIILEPTSSNAPLQHTSSTPLFTSLTSTPLTSTTSSTQATPTTSSTQVTPTTSSTQVTPTTSSTQVTPTSSSIQVAPTTSTQVTSISSVSSTRTTPTSSSKSSSIEHTVATPTSVTTPTSVIHTSSVTDNISTSSPSATTLNRSSGPISSNVIVLASAAIATVIIIAIIIIAIVLVGFCIYSTRRKNDGVDLTDGPSTWPERRPSNMKKYSSKDSSIKGSSLSGSISHSLSSDQDLPSFPSNGGTIHTYANVPSDSPGSVKNERDLGRIEEYIEDSPIDETPIDNICTEV